MNGTHTYRICPSYCLKTEVSIMLHFQSRSTHYRAIKINSCSKSSYVIKVTTMKYKYTKKLGIFN